MIRPPGFRGAAFGAAADGDARSDAAARLRLATALDIDREWATVTQVHGATVAIVATSGHHGEADILVTSVPGVTLAVATADCVPVIIEGSSTVAVVHAGWRGLAAGVVATAVNALRTSGDEPRRAAIGPSICGRCYEVGSEVADALADHVVETDRGTVGVDLVAAAVAQLGPTGQIGQARQTGQTGQIEVWRSGVCTKEDVAYRSYRRDHTRERQVTVGWLPAT